MKTISSTALDSLTSHVVDVREYPEFALLSIPGAELVPLNSLEIALNRWTKEGSLTFVCKSGRRAATAAALAERRGFSDVYVLHGGMDAWQEAGLPIVGQAGAPWSLERQVRFGAGSMVLVSSLLGLLLSPWFFALTVFVGAGLVFAGATDLCLMAKLLGKMPWNRASASRVNERQTSS